MNVDDTCSGTATSAYRGPVASVGSMEVNWFVRGESWHKDSDVCSTREKVARKLKLQKSKAGRRLSLAFWFSCTVEVVSNLLNIFPGFFFLRGVTE